MSDVLLSCMDRWISRVSPLASLTNLIAGRVLPATTAQAQGDCTYSFCGLTCINGRQHAVFYRIWLGNLICDCLSPPGIAC